MTLPAFYVIVSGLPASGKTTLGRRIAERLRMPFIDKDDLLEIEFAKYESISPELRQQLSRNCDETMAQKARALGSGILVSFWRPSNLDVTYGTPTEWIDLLDSPVVELHCQCEPHIAEQRFKQRQRHHGHNDSSRSDTLINQFTILSSSGPLGRWPIVNLNTSDLKDAEKLIDNAVLKISKLS